jgi:hypothetical protein
MIEDIVEGLKLVIKGIGSVQAILNAVRSGEDYVKVKHPKVHLVLHDLVRELGKSMGLIKSASAVLTNFRFAVDADARSSEPARFNDYFIKSKTDAQYLRSHIEDLRSHCSKVRKHAEKIDQSAKTGRFDKVFRFLGLKSPEREQELGKKLHNLANEDFEVANSAETMLQCLEKALREVQDALGPGATMSTQNVPAAAALLAKYGPAFDETERKADKAVEAVGKLVKDLG